MAPKLLERNTRTGGCENLLILPFKALSWYAHVLLFALTPALHNRKVSSLARFFPLALFACSPAFGWWCEGHEVVALIAEKHLSPTARNAVFTLLNQFPVASAPFCRETLDDPLALASTWADVVRDNEKTGSWHYMDIPLGLRKGDPEKFCEPIGPSNNGGPRPGCVLSALRYAVNVIHSDKETPEEKVKALRYLIHLVGDLHQPLHTTSDNDRGGNCMPIQFFDDPKIANLHGVWDGMIFNRDFAGKNETTSQIAAELDQKFLPERAAWIKNAPQFDKWAWEGHLLAQKVVYGDLNPKPPVEDLDPHLDCQAQLNEFGALHIKIGDAYQSEAAPVVEEQIAKAGYRLAEILNSLWP